MDKGGARPAQGARAARAGEAEHASTPRAGRGWAAFQDGSLPRSELREIADEIAREGEGGIAALLNAIRATPESPQAEAALVALHANKHVTDEVAEAALPMLRAADPCSVAAALDFFAAHGDASHVQAAEAYRVHESAHVRAASLRYLVSVHCDALSALLSTAAIDADALVREEAAELIGEMQLRGELHLLDLLVKDTSGDVRQAAGTALEDLADSGT
jgi:hypothetical protein